MKRMMELMTEAWYCRKIWDRSDWADWWQDAKCFAVLFPLFALPVWGVAWLLGGCFLPHEDYRANAMDLCAWHARRNHANMASVEATEEWKQIVSGKVECSFCGQLHDKNWVSRNAWDSQIEAMQSR